jgi:hypothetical protein
MSGMQGPAAPSDRQAHGTSLQQALDSVPQRHRQRAVEAGLAPEEARRAYYLTFRVDSRVHFDLNTLTPRARTSGIRLLATQEVHLEDESIVYDVTVFVPMDQLEEFQGKVVRYLQSVDTGNARPSLADQIDRWQSVDLASLRQFWTDRSPFPGGQQTTWWEIWLRREEDGGSPINDLQVYCQRLDVTLASSALAIDDRLVTLAKASPEQLSSAPLLLGYLAELRLARELATPYLQLSNPEQRVWAEDLAARLLQMGTRLPAVCIVDSGVNRGHMLLEASLADNAQHACQPDWGVDDHATREFIGHGTAMAGLSLLGDRLPDLLASQDNIELRHKLESVKILPRTGGNAPDLHAVRTVEATTGPETTAPDEIRVYVLALTASGSEGTGEPSLWAATIDALAVGRSIYPEASTDQLRQLDPYPDFEVSRLWILSAGNVHGDEQDHLQASDRWPVQNPAEAWNALTVGAMTELDKIENQDGEEEPLAPKGELSPFSRTSVSFEKDRPVKPEIVIEGGNAHVENGEIGSLHGDLSLLTTNYNPLLGQFTLFNGTSAAAALAGRLAARIRAEYPNLWPETIRGLLVHAARWTPAMQEQFAPLRRKRDRLLCLRRYGWGVPDEDRAFSSLQNRLTLLCQDHLQPFHDGQYRQMCLHRLPWPVMELQRLADETVRLRVTLSTFVDPHPSRRGRYDYPSHQLRFALKPAEQTVDQFVARINAAARDENYENPGSVGDDRWYFGSDARSRGSVFCDIWEGPAADLAARPDLAVLPVRGWWKDKKLNQTTRYALLLSIETDEEQADLYTEVAQRIQTEGLEAEIEI